MTKSTVSPVRIPQEIHITSTSPDNSRLVYLQAPSGDWRIYLSVTPEPLALLVSAGWVVLSKEGV